MIRDHMKVSGQNYDWLLDRVLSLYGMISIFFITEISVLLNECNNEFTKREWCEDRVSSMY